MSQPKKENKMSQWELQNRWWEAFMTSLVITNGEEANAITRANNAVRIYKEKFYNDEKDSMAK